MNNFSMHPALRSPLVAAVAFALLGAALVDVGVYDALGDGSDRIDAPLWASLVQIRWWAMLMSGMLAAMVSYVAFAPAEGVVNRWGPVLGVAVALLWFAIAAGMVLSLNDPRYGGNAVVWRMAWVWAFLCAALGVATLRLSVQAYRLHRGRR